MIQVKRLRQPSIQRGILVPLVATISILGLFCPKAQASNNPDRKFYVTDGTVNAVVQTGSTVYIAGDFSYVGPNTGHGAAINTSNALPSGLEPHIGGAGSTGVYAVVADGDGGWYVGGEFTRVADTTVTNLAHINSNKEVVTAFNPDPNGPVRALALSADKQTLYVGGDFTTIDGQARNRLAAVATTDGAVDAWDPDANGSVRSLALDDARDRLFVGGSFSTLGADGAAQGIAAFTASSKTVIAGWAAAAATNAGGSVRALAFNSDGSVLYVGGAFTTIGGLGRNNIAALAAGTGAADAAWNPNADGAVLALGITADDNQLYTGGDFANIGGEAITRIARLDTATGAADATWSHSANNIVSALQLAEDLNRIYLGGDFTSIDGDDAVYNAALPTGSTAAAWTLRSTGPVRALARPSGEPSVFVGGEFTSVGGVIRYKAAALNASTGTPLPWAPKIDNGAVETLILGYDNTEVFLGGSFTNADGNVRNRLAKVDANNGVLSSWAPIVEAGTVRSMAISNDGAQVFALAVSPVDGDLVLAGTEEGLYRSIDAGATWSAVDLNGSASINDIVFDPNTPSRIYVASRGRGIFSSSDSGATWQEDNAGLTTLQATSIALSDDSSRIYVGTKFVNSSIGGLYRRNAGETSWSFARNTDIDTLAVDPGDSDYVYIGNSIGLFVFNNEILFRADQGLRDKTVRHILPSNITDDDSGNRVIYATAASAIYRSKDRGENWENFGRGLPGAALYKIALHPTNNDIFFLATFGRGIYRTGNATRPDVGGVTFQPRNTDLESQYTYTVAVDPTDTNGNVLYSGASLGRLFKSSDGAATWDAAETGIPHNILYVGGDFTGSHPDYIAALETVGTTGYFRAWDPQATGAVNALRISSDATTLYAGGAFTNIGGESRRGLAALTRDTAAATSWAPSIDDGVVNAAALTVTENAIYIGGSFTSVNSDVRNRLALIDTTSAALKPWNPGADGEVTSLALGANDATLIAAGAFTTIGGRAHNYLASLLTEDNAGTATLWDPNPNTAIPGRNALARLNSTIFVGGSFTRIGDMVTRSFAGYTFTVPTVSATPRGSSFQDPQQVSLSCSNSSGTTCATIYYTTDTDLSNANWQLYPNAPLDITTSVQLSFYGVDDEGSRSATQSETYRIDATGPTLTASPVSGTYNYTQTVTLNCDDGDSGSGTDISVAGCSEIYYTDDGSQPTFTQTRSEETGNLVFTPGAGTIVYARPIPVVIDAKLRFIAVDSAGNSSSEGTTSYSIVRVPGGSIPVDFLAVLLIAATIRAGNCASRGRYRRRQ